MDKNEGGLPNRNNDNDIDNIVVKDNENKELIYKTKDYVRRAKKNYYNKKKVNDEEFRGKERERLKKWREENRDKINESARIKRREMKNQKAEKMQVMDRDNLVNSDNNKSIGELVVKTENLKV
jgi:hypothetical protein